MTLTLLSGCASDSSGSFCGIYEPVYDYEVKTIDGNNAVYLERCE